MSEKMKTLVVEKNGDVHISEIPRPEIDETSALVRILASGICGTDKKIIHGTFKGFDTYPCLLGHEAVGEVVEVGSKVKYLQKGDLVLPPYLDTAPQGYATIYGGFSEYAVVHDWRAMTELGIGIGTPGFVDYYQIQKRIPSDFDPVSSVMIITLREVLAAVRHFGFKPDESLVIFGSGAVGMAFAKIAKIFGMSPIILVDVLDEKKKDAKLAGADLFINSSKENVEKLVKDLCPDGVDYVLDAVGVNSIINSAMSLIKKCGQILVYGISSSLGMEIKWEKAPYNWTLKFFQYPEKGEEAAAHEQLISWISQGIIQPEIFISHQFEFKDILEGIRLFESNLPTKKIVITYP